jgi:phenylacetate-CoA ligase
MAPGAGLREQVAHAWAASPAQRARLAAAAIDPAEVTGPESLMALPVMRKDQLGPVQSRERPFGGLLGEPLGSLARIFLSPGEIYDPQGTAPDYWRFGTALAAAGFQAGDVVLNCFNYHLSPAGFIFDAAARSLGCVVIPAGVGQMDMQIQAVRDTGATGFIGLPSYLLSLLEKGGGNLPLTKALVTAEPLPSSLRSKLEAFGLQVSESYGTADLGLVAYQCPHREGLHFDAGVIVEICDPEGHPVAMGEVGEVVVTALDRTYPLLRFGTGDLSAMMVEPCPCGRPALRMARWMGRANDVVKVRGMFVYPRQLEEAMARFGPQVAHWQAVVDQDEHHRDRLRVLVEPANGGGPAAEAVGEAVRATTRMSAEVILVAGGTIPAEARRLEDRRRWE